MVSGPAGYLHGPAGYMVDQPITDPISGSSLTLRFTFDPELDKNVPDNIVPVTLRRDILARSHLCCLLGSSVLSQSVTLLQISRYFTMMPKCVDL